MHIPSSVPGNLVGMWDDSGKNTMASFLPITFASSCNGGKEDCFLKLAQTKLVAVVR